MRARDTKRDTKAEAAFLSYLSEEEAQRWKRERAGRHGWTFRELHIKGSEGGDFLLRIWRDEVEYAYDRLSLYTRADRNDYRAICFRADGGWPTYDRAIAVKCMIEANEWFVRREAGPMMGRVTAVG